jgi:hypothetical protein
MKTGSLVFFSRTLSHRRRPEKKATQEREGRGERVSLSLSLSCCCSPSPPPFPARRSFPACPCLLRAPAHLHQQLHVDVVRLGRGARRLLVPPTGDEVDALCCVVFLGGGGVEAAEGRGGAVSMPGLERDRQGRARPDLTDRRPAQQTARWPGLEGARSERGGDSGPKDRGGIEGRPGGLDD